VVVAVAVDPAGGKYTTTMPSTYSHPCQSYRILLGMQFLSDFLHSLSPKCPR